MKNKLESEATQSQPAASKAPTRWNPKELLEQLDNDRTFLCELLDVYRRDSQSGLQEAKEALARNDLDVVERRAHTLKGMMKNLFMNDAAQTASDLEAAARQGKADDSAVLLGQLERAMNELLPEVDAQMAEAKT
jgi:two-component system, sensor histidine kinase and response regulator